MDEREKSLIAQAEWIANNLPDRELRHLECGHVPEEVREQFLMTQLAAIIERMTVAACQAWESGELVANRAPDFRTQEKRRGMAARILLLTSPRFI